MAINGFTYYEQREAPRGEGFMQGEAPNTWKTQDHGTNKTTGGTFKNYNMKYIEGDDSIVSLHRMLPLRIAKAHEVFSKPQVLCDGKFPYRFDETSENIAFGWNGDTRELRIFEYDSDDWNKLVNDFTFYYDCTIKDNLTGGTYEDYREVDDEPEAEESSESSSTTSTESSSTASSSTTSTESSSTSSSSSSSSGGNQNVNMAQAASTAVKIVGAYKVSEDMLKMIVNPKTGLAISEIAEDLAKEGIEHLTKQSSMLVGKYMQKITELIAKSPAEIAKYSLQRFNMSQDDILTEFGEIPPKYWAEQKFHKMTLGEAIAELGGNLEKQVKEKDEKRKNEKLKKFISNAKEKIPKATNDVIHFVDAATAGFNDVMIHIVEGPAYVEKEMNRVIDDKLGKIDKQLNKIYKDVAKEVDAFNKSAGYTAGKGLIATYNAGIMLAAKTARYLMSKTTAKTQAKAKQLVQVAKIQLMSKLNIELPL